MIARTTATVTPTTQIAATNTRIPAGPLRTGGPGIAVPTATVSEVGTGSGLAAAPSENPPSEAGGGAAGSADAAPEGGAPAGAVRAPGGLLPLGGRPLAPGGPLPPELARTGT